MILCFCAFVPSWVQRCKVEENIPTLAEISQYILPGHVLLVLCAAMLSGCCGSPHELQTFANHQWAMDLEFHVGQVVGL